jgi:hypothetical protein
MYIEAHKVHKIRRRARSVMQRKSKQRYSLESFAYCPFFFLFFFFSFFFFLFLSPPGTPWIRTTRCSKYVEESPHMDVDPQPRSGSECFRPKKTKRARSYLFRYGIRQLLEVHGWNGAVAEEHLPQANSKRVHVRLHVVRLALDDLERIGNGGCESLLCQRLSLQKREKGGMMKREGRLQRWTQGGNVHVRLSVVQLCSYSRGCENSPTDTCSSRHRRSIPVQKRWKSDFLGLRMVTSKLTVSN